ncbi:murein biosynthesis integral membrane protein MurJ [Paractinoplanes rhizophilus]|uniref:Murein biosynthesis integral membrane protein MurJ n=1 Tax=Paractinoplanes rhizophilus TaxID=1416877 RepID=A0ABW2HS08_9ACTN
MASTFFRLLLGGIAGKVLGVVREVLLAALFGAGRAVGANRVALTGTMVPLNFFTADALSAGFLPLYVQYRQDNPAMALALYRSVRTLFVGLSVALLIALQLARGFWIDLLAPGLDHSTAALASSMLAVAALGMPFLLLYSLDNLVALERDDVRLINLRASFQSVGLISATVVAYLTGDAVLLAWGFTTPYFLLWCFGVYWLRKKQYLDGPEPARRLSRIERSHYKIVLGMFWRRLRPLLLIPVLLQGSISVERAVGSLLGVEVVAATEYSRFVVDSLMALIAAPLGLAGLAAFARMRTHEVHDGLRRMLGPILLVTVPLSIALGVNSRGIITVLYARGEFDQRAVDVTSIMLLGFSLGIWANVLGHTLVKVLNARGHNRRAAVANGLSFGIAATVNLVMWRYTGPFTLGLASAVGGVVMFVGAAVSLKIVRHSLGLLVLLAPGIAGATAAGWLLAGDGLVRLAGSCALIGLVWLGYVMLVPSLRAAFVTGLWSRIAKRDQKASPAGETGTVAMPAGETPPAEPLDEAPTFVDVLPDDEGLPARPGSGRHRRGAS